ncbi:MAG TPA: SDR family oxidoreductase [Bacteroidales bacterium]|nr:SDR family oxidoreductase [Bacteroidales bacterium]
MNKKVDEQKVAIVTGGASGLGYAIARKFAANNIRTIIMGRNEAKLKEACESIGANSEYIKCDVTDFKSLPGIVESVIRKYGRIDILVNNAGIHLKKPFLEVTDEEFHQVLLTNTAAVFSVTREVVRVMKERHSGSVLNISSMAAQYGIPLVIAYSAAKAAVEGMTRNMAVELSPEGIRVNCIAPGFIKTKMSGKALDNDPERKRKVLSRTPMGRLGTPEEVADAAYYLVSDEASFITGVVLPVDGGNLIGFS